MQKNTKKHRLIIPRDGACFKAKKKGYSSTCANNVRLRTCHWPFSFTSVAA